MKIMVAEDHATSALLLCRLLERAGHDVTVAGDGEEAWRLAAEDRFPVIISDWVMPGLDGPGLCRRLRAEQGRPYVYLILLTSKQGQQDRLEGLRAGADDFLVKPPDAEELEVRLEIARRILAVQDELESRNARLAELAHSDELTGVKNRRRFRQALEVHSSMAGRQGLPLSLVMVDVDHFKAYNDAFGHPAGDDVLRGVAASLRDGVRRHDEVARYGGEEFAILLPDTAAAVARELAERLRANLAAGPWPRRPITASFGIATTGPAILTPAELVDQADRALYHSKRLGRDRVTHAGQVVEGGGPAGD